MSSAADRKDTGRDGRLNYSNQAEHALRKELSEIAKTACKENSVALGDCARKEGILVVFKCRKEKDALNSCLNVFTNEKAFEEYKQKRALELSQK
ncbi:hypothetical protein TL16_g02510 [Triparma laevis f. inornata]|uniref:COX assembly mitochondrial protein n=2 Tax=Triparma laevis TaxID=1534972 RepID=A0A9W7C9J9_9STRA|nr:hypothetical protein TL16_g02510 [Triparma laevis f. inornata]GMI02497.1 hypothetical protein TrLO_g56 [Triparma laevis f. longispina]